MINPLLDTPSIEVPSQEFLESAGRITHRFGQHTQDSCNVSYIVVVANQCYFVKTAGAPTYTDPLRGFDQRVEWLRNAVRLRKSCDHSLLPTLHNTIESADGPLLVYDGVAGHLLRGSKTDPTSPYNRFRSMPVERILSTLDKIYDVHAQLSNLGWVMVDFYDGTVIYDFPTEAVHLIDLDMYHRGPLTNTLGRWWGSSRFMAPEEFEKDAVLDDRTSVFTLGKSAAVFLSDTTLARSPFRGSEALHDVILKACRTDPTDRFPSVPDFNRAWLDARRA